MRVPDLLVDGDMEILGLMPGSSNATFLARLMAPGVAGAVLTIYKPMLGETPLWDFPDGTLCRREVAAYEVAEALGWPAIPPTVLRDGPEGIGAAQLFVDFDPEHHFFTIKESEELATKYDRDLRRIALFDVVINNADRKGGHLLLGRDGVLWAIDHGVCFNADYKLRTVIWDYIGQDVSAADLSDLAKLMELLEDSGGSLRASLCGLLDISEIDALTTRLHELLDRGVFPEPGPARPYPWPPI